MIQSYRVRFYLLPFIGGIFYSLGFPSKLVINTPIFSLFGMFLLFSSLNLSYTLKNKRFFLQREIYSSLFFSLGYCLVGYYWVPYTISEFGGIYFPWNYILGISFSLIIAPHVIIFVLLKSFLQTLKLKSSFVAKGPYLKSLFYALLMSLLEYFIPQQFPAHIGHTWLSLAPYIGLAPFVGAPVFSFFSYWLVFSLIANIRTKRKDYMSYVSFSIFFLLNILIPLNPLTPDTTEYKTNIRLVQANIGNFLKIQSEVGAQNSIQEVYKRYYDMSTEKIYEKIDLIIWPETAYPRSQNSTYLKNGTIPVPNLIKEVIKDTGAELFTGGYDLSLKNTLDFESEYNTAFHYGDDTNLKDVYHKIKLIPFGESLPFGPLNKYLSRHINNIAYFARGEDYTLFKTKVGSRFVAAICYEILFSNFIRDYLNSIEDHPHFLINLTNDSWYGDTAEPLQHLFLAKWRALEFNIPIVRMTNTGISSVIYPDGRESERTGVLKSDVLDVKLITPNRQATLFQKFGIWILFVIWIFFLGLSHLKQKIQSND